MRSPSTRGNWPAGWIERVAAGPLDSCLQAWRDASPQRAAVWPFLSVAERIRFGALAALEQQWLDAVRTIREPQVAAAKLAWWREEMDLAARGGARHPLTQSLFADARARALPPSCWTAAIGAALARLDAPPPADFAAQLAQAQPLHDALAHIDTALWFGANAGTARARRVAAVAELVAALGALPAEVEHGRSPLPMNLLARHGLTVAALAGDGPARRAAVRDQASELRHALEEAATLPGPLSLFRSVQMRHDLETLRRAEHADNPLQALRWPGGGVRNLLHTWRAARAWRAGKADGNDNAQH